MSHSIDRLLKLFGEDRPSLGLDISESAIAEAKTRAKVFLEKDHYPAYLIDRNLVFHEANDLIIQMIGLEKSFVEQLYGKMNSLDMVFNQDLGIRQRIQSENRLELAKRQIMLLKGMIQAMPNPNVSLEFIDFHKRLYPDFALLWDNVEFNATSPLLAEKHEVSLRLHNQQLNFELVREVFLAAEHFHIVEYYPSDTATMDFIRRLRRQIRGESLDLTSSDISSALRSWNDLAELQQSPLTRLSSVAQLCDSDKLCQAEALKDILRDAIEACAPDERSGAHRSKPRLKYEILRMTAYESATEEQIMWDLGFEPEHDLWANGNPDKARSPRYPYRGKGDYAATSRASFKRLKNQALDDLAWQLEQREQG